MVKLNGSLEPIGYTAPVDMPELDLANFDDKLGEVRNFLHQLPSDAIHLDSSQYFIGHDWRDSIPADLSSGFVVQQDFGIGRDQYSANHVYFGQLIVSSGAMLDLPEFVAVKPHESGDDLGVTVMREYAAHNHMNGLSSSEKAYVPLGVWRDPAGDPQLVTLYDHGVVTFDNVFWPKEPDVAARITDDQVRDAFRSCMYGTGLLTGAGVAHGDDQVKNQGIDRRRVRFVDFENMELLPLDEASADVAKDLALADLDKLVNSTLFYNDVNGRMVDIAVQMMTNPDDRNLLVESYLAGRTKSMNRLGTAIPDSALVTPVDIFRSFDFAVQISGVQDYRGE